MLFEASQTNRWVTAELVKIFKAVTAQLVNVHFWQQCVF